MPELPEVETVRSSLASLIIGTTVQEVKINEPRLLRNIEASAFRNRMLGARLNRLERTGKVLVFNFGGSVLLVQLGMTGQLLLRSSRETDDKHVHLILSLNSGRYLWYRDVRKFGRWRLYSDKEFTYTNPLTDLGPDPLTPEYSWDYFSNALARRRSVVKAVLLDQKFLAGLGNIYADEALFRAKVRPDRIAVSLHTDEMQRLYQAIPEVLNEGIAHGGTTFSDYLDGLGRIGQHQRYLQVYGRYGKPCVVCGHTLQRSRLSGRTTTWCNVCQS